RVRIAAKVVSAPVLVGLWELKRMGRKWCWTWSFCRASRVSVGVGLVQGLVHRGLKRPSLVIIDGNKGLRAAVEKSWPGIKVQRCTVHKLRNVERHVPRHALEEVKSDYHKIINAESLQEGNKAYRAFVVKWKKRAPKVVVSLEEAGEELLT